MKRRLAIAGVAALLIALLAIPLARPRPADPRADLVTFLDSYEEVRSNQTVGSFHRRESMVAEAQRARLVLRANHGWRVRATKDASGEWEVVATAVSPGRGGPWLRRIPVLRAWLGPQPAYTLRLGAKRYFRSRAESDRTRKFSEPWIGASLIAEGGFPFQTPPDSADIYARHAASGRTR